MSGLRSLVGVADAARAQGIEVTPTVVRGAGEVLLECPVCKAGGVRQLASVQVLSGAPSVRCYGCERWGDDPHAILGVLSPGYDPDECDPHEIELRVFDLLWSLYRWEVAA